MLHMSSLWQRCHRHANRKLGFLPVHTQRGSNDISMTTGDGLEWSQNCMVSSYSIWMNGIRVWRRVCTGTHLRDLIVIICSLQSREILCIYTG